MKSTALRLVLTVVVYCSCSQQAEQQPREPESEDALSATENAAIQPEVRIPSEVEAQEMLELQNRIMKSPGEVALRRALGEKAIMADAGVVWSIGRGKISPTTTSLSVAQSQAELAARIDAARWAAYLLEWQKNGYATAFGALQAQAPGGEVINKTLNDSTCIVLVKTPLH